jgi:hypothetical protein
MHSDLIKMEESSTYEATKARKSTQSQPDKVHWDATVAFRDSPYRLLHHQRGLIGTFRVRLLEAKDLQRSYWSALALGPVKHLGLSKAHGAVSSFCTLSLDFEDPQAAKKTSTREDLDRKPAAKDSKQPKGISPVIMSDNNPVWDNTVFEFPLRKGMPDGRRILLTVRADEDATTVENFLPGVPSGGDSRLLGVGSLDLTELCLGERLSGQALPGVFDAWIEISLAGQPIPEEITGEYDKDDPLAPPVKKLPPPPATTGLVRVLVSYTPYGIEPQSRDVIALEAFARRNPMTASCRPILPPLLPLVVIERRGSYILAEYSLPDQRQACVRIHRNAVFVIERQNMVDAAHNLALLPVDVVLSTPLGQATSHALGPVVAAGRELLMPALLSFKLLWVAARTTTLAGISGVGALGRTMWHEGSTSLTASHQREHNIYDDRRRDNNRRDGTAQFVSL